MKLMRCSLPPLFFLLLFWLTFVPDIHASPSAGLWEDLPPHADFPIEWWYMTGFLKTEKGRNLGFQATFFRMKNNEQPPDQQSARGPWSPHMIFGFHGAVSDLDRKTFVSTERERRGFGRSVATQDHPFSVSIGRNRLDHKDATASTLGLFFRVANQSFALELTPLSPPVWHAAHKKFFTGPRPIDYAYYYSYPLVTVEGTRTIVHRNGTITHERVHGQCWFDHEWMSQTLAPGQIGWIWLWAWNKENTRGIMLYQMLDQEGKLSPFHRATVLERKGVDWTVTRTRNVRLLTGKNGRCLDLSRIAFLEGDNTVVRVHPEIDRQLLTGAVFYWEGAARITLGPSFAPESGKGYLEVTGLESLREGSLCSEN